MEHIQKEQGSDLEEHDKELHMGLLEHSGHN